MKLKSYFSATVEAAVEQARQELGEDALLVNARPSTPDTRHLGAYEVVFGAAGAPQVPAAASSRFPRLNAVTAPKNEGRNTAANGTLARDVAEMRREIERLANTLRGASMIGSITAPAPEGLNSEVYLRLIEQELTSALAQAVAQGSSLAEFFETDATLGRKGAGRAVVALVGPPGAGKTTTLIKLAARYGLASRKPAQIITTDVFRIAAADQLRSLASILGIGCEIAETPVALAQALEEHRLKDFVFVDTPGLAACEMEDGADLAALIAGHPEIDTHLVLPASMKPADIARTIERYLVFQPKKLLFTRMDETDRYGALISEASRHGLPISFLATGQQIPDDLEAASKERLVELVQGRCASLDPCSTPADGATPADGSTPADGESASDIPSPQKTAGAAA